MALETIGLRAVLEGASSYLSNLDKVEKAEKKVGEEAENASKRTDAMGKTLTKMSLLGTTAFVGLGAVAIKFATGFEQQMDQVGAVLQANDQEMKQLGDTAKQLGADTAFSAGDAAKAMEELAAGGRSVAQIIGGEAKAAVSLAAAGNYDLANSARTIATTMDIWKDSSIETTDVVNRLAGAANSSRFGVEDMSQAIASGGGVAAQAGVSFQDFSTVIAATASSFNSGSDAGTSFKTFVTSLTGNSEKAKDMIKELGLEFYNAQGQLKPMSEIVSELNTKLSGLSQEQQTVALKTIFGNDAFRTAAGLMKMTGEEFTAMSNKMRDTDAADVANQRMDNLAGSLEALQGSLETLAIQVGERAIPMINGLAQGATALTNGFAALPASTQTLVLGFSAIVVALPALISGIKSVTTLTQSMGLAMQTTGGKAALMFGALGVAIIGLDIASQKFTGASLTDRIFGDVAKSEANNKAMREWDAILQVVGPNADKAALAMGQMNSLIDEVGGSMAELPEKASGFTDFMLGSDARFFGFNVGASGSIDKTKEFEARVETLGAAMREQGVDVMALKRVYDELPPSLQDNFDKVTNVRQAYEELEKSFDVDRIEAYRRAGLLPLNEAHKSLSDVILPKAATALDTFNEGIKETEERTGEAVDRAKEFEEALDNLAGRFADFNPEVIEAQGKLAAVDEELADLARSGGEWSSTLGMTKTELEAVKKGLEDQIGAAEENQKATKGMRDELRQYIGEGLINMQSKLKESTLSLEEQVDAEIKVGEALRALSKDDVPGFIKAMQEIETKVPGIAQTVYNELGPDLKAKIDGAQGLMREAGLGLATALSQGLIAGLNGASTDVGDASSRMMSDAIAAANATAGISSPSKVTEHMGRMLAEGLINGIKAGGEKVPAAAAAMIGEIEENMGSTIIEWINKLGDDVRLSFMQLLLDQEKMLKKMGLTLFEDGSIGNLDPAAYVTKGGGQAILGSDGKWYPDEASMPKGVTGASTTATVLQNHGGGISESIPLGPDGRQIKGPNGTVWDPEAMAFVMPWMVGSHGAPNDRLSGSGIFLPAMPSLASLPLSQGSSTTSNSKEYVFDFRGAQLTGTLAENERMIRNVVYEALGDVSGRDAFLSGVK